MKLRLLLPFFLLMIAAQWRQDATLAITSPAADEILRGPVTIAGTLDVPSFASAQLDFAYASHPTDTWFPLQTFSEPVIDATLAVWDTTWITDGDYILRLRVNFEDGTFQEVTVPVKIANDALPTPTPAPTATPEEVTVFVPTPFLLAASPTPTEIPRPTPTALPSNPASLGQKEIYASLSRGALVILGLFALAGLIIRIRRF
ncbi:MAG TPA: hypothetical protein VK880_12400 [Anaerolineales bacterium]|nr:hypothetical protein [Anaerolineales bacterium]